jgi:hypothetical protein
MFKRDPEAKAQKAAQRAEERAKWDADREAKKAAKSAAKEGKREARAAELRAKYPDAVFVTFATNGSMWDHTLVFADRIEQHSAMGKLAQSGRLANVISVKRSSLGFADVRFVDGSEMSFGANGLEDLNELIRAISSGSPN